MVIWLESVPGIHETAVEAEKNGDVSLSTEVLLQSVEIFLIAIVLKQWVTYMEREWYSGWCFKSDCKIEWSFKTQH